MSQLPMLPGPGLAGYGPVTLSEGSNHDGQVEAARVMPALDRADEGLTVMPAPNNTMPGIVTSCSVYASSITNDKTSIESLEPSRTVDSMGTTVSSETISPSDDVAADLENVGLVASDQESREFQLTEGVDTVSTLVEEPAFATNTPDEDHLPDDPLAPPIEVPGATADETTNAPVNPPMNRGAGTSSEGEPVPSEIETGDNSPAVTGQYQDENAVISEAVAEKVGPKKAKPKKPINKADTKRSDSAKKAAATKAKADETKAEKARADEVKAVAKRAKAEKVEVVVREIQRKQAQIGKNERANLPLLVGIGVHLIELQRAAEKDWAKTARKLGYHPREASRFQLLGRNWGNRIGTIGSDLLAKLPTDLKMLEWICRVPFEQLGTFLEAKDASEQDGKKWVRKRVAVEVKVWIGEPAKPASPVTPDDFLQSFGRAVSRTTAAFQRSNTESVSGLRATLHSVLDEALDKLEATSGLAKAGTAPISPE